MPVPISRLRVCPNPYIVDTIDHLGRPAGRVPLDPYEDSPRGPKTAGIGAEFAEVKETHAEQAVRFGSQSVQLSAARHDHRIAYVRGVVEIRNTGYYRDAIRAGLLFAADAKTFVAAGGVASKFVEPAKALEAAKFAAIERFNASTGEDAHAEMGAFEPLWIGEEPAAAPAPAPNKVDLPKPSFAPPSKPADDAKGDAK